MLSQAQGRDSMAAAVDLNAAVNGFANVMGQQVGEAVQLTGRTGAGASPVRLAAGCWLLELVLLNLVRNTANAMPYGGKVVLRTKGLRLDQFAAADGRVGHRHRHGAGRGPASDECIRHH